MHLPILSGKPNERFIEILPPPELHLLIGTVSTMYKGLENEWPQVNQWATACNVVKEAMHGGTFTGNSARMLLNKVDILQAMCPLTCLPYVMAFRNFAKVIDSCFGGELNCDYETYIDRFKDSYMDLGISVTPKVHAVFHHVIDSCNKTQKPLGNFSEQASESVHADFKKIWKNYKVLPIHPDYNYKLTRAIQEYNSLHI